MEILLLLSIIFGASVQNVIKKYYNKRVGGGVFIFSAVSVICALIFFIASASFPLKFTLQLIPYALGFAASYCTATVFSFLAIKEGPLSLSSLMTSFSLLIPTLFGIFFYGDEAGVPFFIGLSLLLCSLVLINLKKEEGIKITLKWGIYVTLAFLGNGLCSTVQNGYAKVHNTGKNEFMIIALSVVAVVLIVIALFTEKEKIAPSIKGGAVLMAICGLANGAVNLFVILLSSLMDASIMFPLISAGGIVLTSLVAIFLYKEKLSPIQYLGMLLGIGAIVFLNL